jgi:hypothetical protein
MVPDDGFHLNSWIRIRIRVQNAHPDPDSGDKINFDKIVNWKYLHTSSFFIFLNIFIMKRTLIFLQFKTVNKYTNIKVNFKSIFAKCGILNLGIRSWIRIQTFLEMDPDPVPL